MNEPVNVRWLRISVTIVGKEKPLTGVRRFVITYPDKVKATIKKLTEKKLRGVKVSGVDIKEIPDNDPEVLRYLSMRYPAYNKPFKP